MEKMKFAKPARSHVFGGGGKSLSTLVAATLVGLSFCGNCFAAEINPPALSATSLTKGGFVAPFVKGGFKGDLTGFAVTLTPTLDTVKAESESYLNTSGHGQYTLSETSTGAANEHSIKLWDASTKTVKTYYYTAAESSADMNKKLVNLVNSGFAAMKDVTSTGNWVLKLGDTYYGYDTDKLPSSVFSYSTGDSSDYTFKYTDGTTTSYYKVDLTPAKMSTSNTITFTKDGSAAKSFVFDSSTKTGSGVVKVTLPHNGTTADEYYTYNYSQPTYEVKTGSLSRIDDSIADDGTNVQNKIFYNISTYIDGGAIHNTQDKSGVSIISDFIGNYVSASSSYLVGGGAIDNQGTIGSIVGDFVGNYASSSYANGGAIYNYTYSGTASIGSIVGDFVGNYASSSSGSSQASGGAIYNYANGTNATASIGSIVGDFVGNYASSSSSNAFGGAIHNYNASIGSIVGDFVGNYASPSFAYGGAIYNYKASIGSIIGDFVGNYASGSSYASGGAIYNYTYSGTASIGSIVADFVGNYASSSSQALGGAIYNSSGSIGSIVGDFVGNYASSGSSSALGGAIYNDGNAFIGSIVGDFVGNYATSSGSSYARGGAIYNDGNASIGSIVGDFVGNYATSSGSSFALGGAIYNYNNASISSIVGDFVGNYASASSSSYSALGGAIYNSSGSIGSIVGDFVGNYATSSGSSYARGGAIYIDYSTIGSIVGDFVGNYATSSRSANGGAIYNSSGTIGSIVGDFVGNYAKTTSTSYKAYGGAIYNGSVSSGNPSYNANSKITLGGNTFTGNYTQQGTNPQVPNSIYNAGVINIAENATVTVNDGWQTYAHETDTTKVGQLVMGTGSTLNMNIGNGTIQEDSLGKITNVGTINATVDIDTSDVSNPLADTITVSSVTQSGKINLTGLKFIGGDIDDFKEHLLTVQILKNTDNTDTLQLALAGAFEPSGEVVLQQGEKVAHSDTFDGTANWDSTYESYNLSTDVMGTIGLATTDTTNDSIGVTVTRTVETKSDITVMDTLKVVNQSDIDGRTFTAVDENDSYTATDDLGKAGAGTITINGNPNASGEEGATRGTIDLDSHTGFELDKATSLNLNDVTITNAGTSSDILNATSADAEIVLKNTELDGTVKNAGEMSLENSEITGIVTNTGTLNIGDNSKLGSTLMGSGTTNINSDFKVENPIIGNDITLNNGAELSFGTNGLISEADSFTVNSGTVNLQNGTTANTDLGNVTLNGNMNLKIDGDFASELIDTITVKSIEPNGNNIVIGDVNILTPTTKESFSISPIGATQDAASKQALADAIKYEAGDLAMTPIYKYHVNYNPEDAMLQFTRFGGGGSDDFNPSVLASPVVAQAGIQATMNETINYSFHHADSFTKLPRAERMAIINANKYAMSLPQGEEDNSFSSTDFNQNLELAANQYKNNAGIWVKPYASFEKINLSGGPNVDTITYGTLVGFDTDFKELKHGWDSVFTGYVGYNGAHLSYNKVSSTLNGGILGATETFYKGNFWTALTANVGASVADTSTMYGNENSTSLLAGIASKTGYNFEFKGGKIILQPIWTMSYSMINTFDYKNAAGVKIDSDPLHTIQLNPSIRLIGNLKNGWQPYASVGFVWNLLNQTHVSANGTSLPNMHIRPYVQYGVGVQKSVGDRFTGFGQVMMHNGGRNGVALTFGGRWALGKDSKKAKTNKTSKNKSDNKVIKQAKNITPRVSNAQFVK